MNLKQDVRVDEVPPIVWALVVSVLLLGAFWYFIDQDMVAEIDAKQVQLGVLQAEINRARRTVAKLEDFKRDVAALEEQFVTLLSILPKGKETENLLDDIHAYAQETNLLVQSFQPRGVYGE